MYDNKFYKVRQSGGSYVIATFYNPVTGESNTECVRDYDYADGSRDNDELYYMDIDEEVRILWLHSNGVILVGDTVEVIKGRTLPKGYVGVVKDIKPYKDRYGRVVCDYLYFEDGNKIAEHNCKLILD